MGDSLQNATAEIKHVGESARTTARRMLRGQQRRPRTPRGYMPISVIANTMESASPPNAPAPGDTRRTVSARQCPPGTLSQSAQDARLRWISNEVPPPKRRIAWLCALSAIAKGRLEPGGATRGADRMLPFPSAPTPRSGHFRIGVADKARQPRLASRKARPSSLTRRTSSLPGTSCPDRARAEGRSSPALLRKHAGDRRVRISRPVPTPRSGPARPRSRPRGG
jgi:hypothetical protein